MNSQQQRGFTLIELVVVIVILGILAATALPKFVSIKSDAQQAAVLGVAGAANSAFSVNYGVFLANTAKASAISSNVGFAAALGSIMVGGLPSGYTATGSASVCSNGPNAGSTQAFTISNASFTAGNNTASATLICTG